jgi:phosphatidylserine/phosphatidylglycerophosphate/cardiolipin synthase-like enzyme
MFSARLTDRKATLSTARLGRIAREALLLVRQFLARGEFDRAANAALKAAEAFEEIAKHSTGSAHRLALRRGTTMVEITKALRRGEPLRPELADALESFYPSEPAVKSQLPQEPQAPTTSEEASGEAEDSTMTEEAAPVETTAAGQHELLSGIAIACRLRDMLERASQSIRIMVQNLTDVKTITVGTETCDVHLLDRLIAKANQGVKVQLIVREPEVFGGLSNHFQQAVERLLQQAPSLEILVCAQMHIKAVIVDAAEVLEGSANFTGKGLSGIGEQATWTSNPAFVAKFVERFDHYWTHQSSECTTECKNRTCEVHPLTRRT